MRKWFASLAALGFVSVAANAQTLGPPPPVGGCGQSQSLLWDDGTAESGWKVRSPTGHKDAFNVDFDDLAGNMTVTGIALNTFQTGSSGSFGIRYVSLCPDNLAVDSLGHTPDLVNPLTQLGSRGGTVTITGSPGVSAGFCPGPLVYDVPDVNVGTTGGAHTVMSFLSGDSSTWMCGDQTAPNRHSFFTSTAYTTPATSLSSNLMMRVVGTITPPAGGSAYFTVQNSAGNVTFSETDQVVVTLWSTAAVQPTLYLQGILITGFPFIPVPQTIMQTGTENFLPISDQFQGTLCGPAGPPCGFAGLQFSFGAFYIDNADLKKNGNGKIKSTNLVPVLVTPGAAKICNPCLCFGQVDDGLLDLFIWKIGNPSGPADWWTNRLTHSDGTGAPCATPATYTSVQAISWDFCGSGPSWAAAGIYPANTVLDPTGNTPDITNPMVACTTLNLPGTGAFTGDWSYPATTYDFPDVNASTNTTFANATVMHVSMQYPLGDTCIWLGSDSDGVDDDATSTGSCTTLPATASFFTANGFTTVGTNPGVNMQMRVTFF